jgi:RNA polymerase sigma-70 factor (ECF subfamily)
MVPPARRAAMTAPTDDQRAAAAAHEAQLMARVAAGDRGAPLEELYDRYAARLYAVGLRRLRDHGAAEDLVQECFVRLWRSAPRFDPARGTVGGLLFAIADRAATDIGRRRAGQPVPTALDADLPALGGAGGAVEPSEHEQLLTRDVLQAALYRVSPDQREVLRLRYQLDLTQAETARRLGVPLGTVKTREFYALRTLREVLEEDGQDG